MVTAATCSKSERMPQPRPSAVAILSRMALSAGMHAGDRGRAPIISADRCSAMSATAQRGHEIRQAVAQHHGRSAPRSRGRECRRAAPAARIRRAPGAGSRAPEKPSVFSTPISRVRSRTAMHHGVADDHQDGRRRPRRRRASTISAMLPNCAANALLNAFSVSVEVSSEELANIVSIGLGDPVVRLPARWSAARSSRSCPCRSERVSSK